MPVPAPVTMTTLPSNLGDIARELRLIQPIRRSMLGSHDYSCVSVETYLTTFEDDRDRLEFQVAQAPSSSATSSRLRRSAGNSGPISSTTASARQAAEIGR